MREKTAVWASTDKGYEMAEGGYRALVCWVEWDAEDKHAWYVYDADGNTVKQGVRPSREVAQWRAAYVLRKLARECPVEGKPVDAPAKDPDGFVWNETNPRADRYEPETRLGDLRAVVKRALGKDGFDWEVHLSDCVGDGPTYAHGWSKRCDVAKQSAIAAMRRVEMERKPVDAPPAESATNERESIDVPALRKLAGTSTHSVTVSISREESDAIGAIVEAARASLVRAGVGELASKITASGVVRGWVKERIASCGT